MKTNSETRKIIKALLQDGYSKSELARTLEVSRSTLIHILSDPKYKPSKTVLNRIMHNLEWIDKTKNAPLFEVLSLLYFKHQNVLDYYNIVSQQAEEITGFKLRYHGMTTGRPVGFMLLDSPGVEPITDIYAKCQEIFPLGSYGRTETMVISTKYRYSCDHEQASFFYNKHPKARIYLLLFYSYSFTAADDMQNIKKIFLHSKYEKDVFLLENGFLMGRYDYFFLFMTKDENSYHQFLSDKHGVYDVTNRSQTESTALTISPQGRPLFQPGHYNLSFNPKEV